MLVISLHFISFMGSLHQVVKYAYHKITDFGNRKTKTSTAFITNIAFVFIYLFAGTERICKKIENF